ncbi:MAG: phage tail protein [Aeromonadaceae bacterium]
MSDFLTGFAKGFMESLTSKNSSPEPSVMMALGPLRFGVTTQEYESLRSSMSWRWAEKGRYLREPALQYHGPGTITKALKITVVAEYGVDLEFLPMVQALGDTGEPQRMIAGHSRPIGGANVLAGGSDMGLWCIVSLDITESEFMRDGTAILYEADLTIKSYGEDKA